MDEEENYEEDASDITGDLELDEEERRMLEMAEDEDAGDIEDLGQEEKMIGKKRKKPVQIKMEDELELEYEREDQIKPKK
jgi:hypothetical protein